MNEEEIEFVQGGGVLWNNLLLLLYITESANWRKTRENNQSGVKLNSIRKRDNKQATGQF